LKRVKQNRGVKIPNARVWAGWDKGIYLKNRRLAREAGNAGGQKGRGLGGRNFCPPSLSDSDFSAAEFRFSLREKRRQLKRCCPCPSRPYAGNNKELPLFLLTKQIKLCIIMLVLVIGF